MLRSSFIDERSTIEVPPKAVLPMDAAFGGAPFEGAGRSYPSGTLSPSYLSGSYRLVPKVSMGSEAILACSDHRSSSIEVPPKAVLPMDTTFGRAPFEDPGRSYPSGTLAPSYLSGSYRLVPKVSMGSEGVLACSDHRSSSFIIDRRPWKVIPQWSTSTELSMR